MPDASSARISPREESGLTTAALPRHRTAATWALAALLFGGIAIALSPIFVRLSELGPTATAFYRTALAVPALFLWMQAEGRVRKAPQPATAAGRLPPRAAWALATPAFFLAGDLILWHWSIRFTSVANATLLANFTPIFVTLFGFLLFGQRVRPAFLGALAVTVAGAAVLVGESVSLSRTSMVGDALGIVTATFYASYILSVARLRTQFGTAAIMAWTALGTSVLLFPAALASGESLWPATVYGWSILLGLALVSHSIGQSTITFALAHLPASFSSVGLLVQPAMAAVFAWAILGEPLTVARMAGGAIVLIGILLAKRAS
ncbi:MAG TPA: DMT family transporter [Stellaceae bacterium]